MAEPVRVVVVTAAGSGIGRAVVELFAERGHRVVASTTTRNGWPACPRQSPLWPRIAPLHHRDQQLSHNAVTLARELTMGGD